MRFPPPEFSKAETCFDNTFRNSSERTRDKIAATRRKGKWSGGMPVLGYTVQDTKLIVDECEAERVRDIFDLYLHRGLLRCEACGCGMSHPYSKKSSRLYRYYVCHHAQKNGSDKCPSPSLPAGEIEQFVVDLIRRIGKDPALIRDTVAERRRQTDLGVKRLTSQKAVLVRGLGAECAEVANLLRTTLTQLG